MKRNYYRMDNGGMSQDSGTNQQQQIIQEVAQALQQGAQPEQVAQQLIQMGIPQDQAVQLIQSIMQQMQGGMGQQAPQMGYGGIPYAAMGMSFGTGDVSTIPNIENYPSYDTYKQDYNQYISSIDTTTTEAPIDYSKYADEAYFPELDKNDTINKFANRINKGLINLNDTTGNITADASNNGITSFRDTGAINGAIQDEINKAAGNNNGFGWPSLIAAGVGFPLAAWGTYKGGKWLNDKRVKRWGTVNEIDRSKLSQKDIDMLDKRVSNYKLQIDNRGYTVGKRDVNELVLRGMPRAEAEAYVKDLPNKQQFKDIEKARGKKPEQQTTTPAEETQPEETATTETKPAELNIKEGSTLMYEGQPRTIDSIDHAEGTVTMTDGRVFKIKDIDEAFVAQSEQQKSQPSTSAETKSTSPTPTSKPTTEQVNKTKEQIKSKTSISKRKSMAELLAERPGTRVQGETGYRGAREFPHRVTTGRKRNIEKEMRKQEVEKKIEKGEFKLAMGGYVPEYAAQAYGASNLPQFEMGSYYADGGAYTGTWNANQGFAYGGSNPFEDNPLRRFIYADGGMSPEEAAMMQQQQGAMPEQGGGEEDPQMQQLVEAVVDMLQQGMPPEQIMQQLIQAGVPQEMAQQVVQHVIEQTQQQQAPQQEQQMPMPPQQMYGGAYSHGGSYHVGDEIDVTPAQLERLKRQGIQFEIIK